MAQFDLALTALTFPDPTPDRAIQTGVALARRLGGELALLALRVRVPVPRRALAGAAMGFEELALEEEGLSRAAAQQLGDVAECAAAREGQPLRLASISGVLLEESEALMLAARTRDLCLLPIGPSVAASRGVAEAVLLGSGRPVLVYSEDLVLAPASRFATVAIAWDGGERAARAVGDALPVLKAAGQVRVFVAADSLLAHGGADATDLLAYLARHGITAVVDHWPLSGHSAASVLETYVGETGIDLLVMGAFAHTRAREYVFGGVTRRVLEAPFCPTFMSH
ncbi:MAG: universal stress protein [Phenylobacterium sp.]